MQIEQIDVTDPGELNLSAAIKNRRSRKRSSKAKD